jgi:hypothetical protein
MTRQKTLIIVGAVILAILAAALVMLLKTPAADPAVKGKDDVFYLLKHDFKEIASISVKNEYGFYDVKQKEGGFTVYDIPADLVNAEYLQLLLDESSRIAHRKRSRMIRMI